MSDVAGSIDRWIWHLGQCQRALSWVGSSKLIIRTRIWVVTVSPLVGTDGSVLDCCTPSELLVLSIYASQLPRSSARCQGSCSESKFLASFSAATVARA